MARADVALGGAIGLFPLRLARDALVRQEPHPGCTDIPKLKWLRKSMKTFKFTIIVSVFAGFLLVGCSDNPLSDLTLAEGSSTVQEQALTRASKMVPIEGRATFAADLTVVPPVQDCGFGEQFFRRSNGEGNYSHLGYMTIVIESRECWINLDDFTLGTKGPMTITAANGDQLWGNWAGKMYGPNLDGGPSLWDFYAYTGVHPVEITGGTGRFDGAHGYVAGGGTFDFATLTGTYWIDGMLSSVGSLK